MRLNHFDLLPEGAFQPYCKGMMRMHGGGGGGGSQSSSTTETTTNNYDKRVAVETGVGLSSDSSTVTVNALDAGAVARAFDFASGTASAASLIVNNTAIGALEAVDRANLSSLDFARGANLNALDFAKDTFGKAFGALAASDQETSKTLAQALEFAKTVFMSGLEVLDEAGTQINSQTELIAKAWDNAKGSGTEKQTLFYVAVGAVALVAVVTVWGKK